MKGLLSTGPTPSSFPLGLHMMIMFMYTRWFVSEIFTNHKVHTENQALESQISMLWVSRATRKSMLMVFRGTGKHMLWYLEQ